MRRLCPPSRSSLIGLFLGLLLVAVGGEPHTATAQAPSFDSDQPIQSLEQATVPAESDSALVALGTALQKARADTEISFQEYKDGVRFFQQNHPGFYGNFFGDPFYATYDIRYSRLAWERQMAEPDINPPNGVRTNTWFFCPPSHTTRRLTANAAASHLRCRTSSTFRSDLLLLLRGGPRWGPIEIVSGTAAESGSILKF